MTVRAKAIALVVASLIIGLVSIHLTAHIVLIPSYATLERQFVETDVQRAISALNVRLAALDNTNHDWASWDDAYDFVLSRSPEFVDSNMVDSTFSVIRVNVIAVVDTSGNLVFARAYDFVEDVSIPVPDGLMARLSTGSPLFLKALSEEGVRGILSFEGHPMLISARPVLASDEGGPPRGVLVMAAFLDEHVLAELSDTTGMPVSLLTLPATTDTILPDFPRIISPVDIAVTPLGSDLVEGSAVIHDLDGLPVLRISIFRDRAIYAEGQNTLSFFLTILAIGGIVLCALVLLLADRFLFRRIARLASEVRSIGEETDFAGKVSVIGDDEIAFLAGTINETLAALARTHRQLHASHSELTQTTADLRRAQQELGTTANQLRRLTRHLQAIREDERALVANEIHDQVGQGLTALKMDIAALEKASLRGKAPAQEFLQQMTQIVDTLLHTVRRLSSSLRPSMLEDLGLAETFQWHLRESIEARGIATSLRIQGPVGSVESGRALTLFRILQEALQVSAEDASVTELSVTLTIEARYALLAVQDNGTAALAGDALSRREMGLSLIRERTEVYGGGVTIASTPELGTLVVAQVPL